ncbi:prefoldin subunit beta [Candidatus Woesearchaeota archaeon]|nr:prefoldin subunit beta [Candidatus Woesearchaeota archaeon]
MSKTNKDVQAKIEKLQLLEQKTQTLLAQKQNFQSQLLEIENATNELEISDGQIYKIVGNIMISAEKNKLKEDLNNKKDILLLRMKNIEKQENKLREEASQVQSEIMSNIKKEGK